MDLAVLLQGRAFLEGPRWRQDRLWLSDVPAGEVLAVDMDGSVELVAALPGAPSGLGWLPDGTLLVARGNPAAVMSVGPTGEVSVHCDLTDVAAFPPNDMVVDASGRAWLGTCDIAGIPTPAASQLILVDPDGSASVVDDGMRFPNGSVVTPDGRTLIVAETFGSALTAFSVDASGGLSHKRVWADIPGCFPDGICLDAQGAVWFADAAGRAAVRVEQGGRITDRVEVDRGCYACTLGGPDGRTLFLLTGHFGSPSKSLAERPGRVETVTVDVPASGSP